MEVRKYVAQKIRKIEHNNEHRTKNYKKRLKEQLRVNLLEKKESIKQNNVLISRFYDAKPEGLNQMQLAFKNSLNKRARG